MLSLMKMRVCMVHKENSRQRRDVSASYPMSRSVTSPRSRVKAKVAGVALAEKEENDHQPEKEQINQLPYDLQEMQQYMTDRAVLVTQELDKIFAIREPEDLFKMIRYAILGHAKRIRPILCLATCELLGGKMDEAMAAACAVEIIHNMSLIHDDLPCMDNDLKRRGKNSVWAEFGYAPAILAGDAMLIYPIEYLLDDATGLDKHKAALACFEIAKTAGIHGLVGGQLVDIQNTLEPEQAGKVRLPKPKMPAHVLEELHLNKTAKLLEAAVVCGAIMSGKSDNETYAKLRKYARNIGLAYQVIDDILDVLQEGDDEGSGKDGKDKKGVTTTYPALYGVDKSREIAYGLIEEAKQQIVSLGRDPKLTAPLIAIADYILVRQS